MYGNGWDDFCVSGDFFFFLVNSFANCFWAFIFIIDLMLEKIIADKKKICTVVFVVYK